MKENNNIHYDVKIRKVNADGKLKAFASVNINDAFAVRGIRIIEGSKGLFMAMPSKKDHKGEYQDMFFPITAESRKALQNAVFKAYEFNLSQEQNEVSVPTQSSVPTMSM